MYKHFIYMEPSEELGIILEFEKDTPQDKLEEIEFAQHISKIGTCPVLELTLEDYE